MIPIRNCTGCELRWRSVTPGCIYWRPSGWRFAVELGDQTVGTARLIQGLGLIFQDSEGELTVRNAGVDPRASVFRQYLSFFQNATRAGGWDTILVDETKHEEVARAPLSRGNRVRFADGTEYIWSPNNPFSDHTWSQVDDSKVIMTFQTSVIRILEQPHPDHTRFLLALGIRHLIL